jgi:2-keto-4-pentenoate hydratase/2-oxohepta-3-ene-1,7-dioic acid hydratase in catechol pathway
MAARNYEEHATEMAQAGRTAGTTTVVDANVRRGLPGLWTRASDDPRGNPFLFPKLRSSIIADGEPIVLPPGRGSIDFECELVAVIGRTAKRVAPGQAADYIFGYTAMTDVSDREDRADARYGSDWLISKSHDTFGPLGPWLVTRDEVPEPGNLGMFLDVNGERRQTGHTRTMIFTVPVIVSYISQFMTLHPGDVIPTGTPPGVAMGMKPPRWLMPGDVVELGIEGLGAQRQTVLPPN